MVLATGFNVPHVDMIALLRPTQSAGLFLQQVGRGLRNAPGKTDCLVLDFAGNTKRHGPIDMVEGSGKPSKAGDESEKDAEKKVMAKDCPKCMTIVRLSVMKCPSCGHEWPAPVPKHEAIADATRPIISTVRPEWVPVDKVSYHRHLKAGSPDSLCVNYHCGMIVHREWICLEHEGKLAQRQKAPSLVAQKRRDQAARRHHRGPGARSTKSSPSLEISRLGRDGRFFRIGRAPRFRSREAAE